MSMNELCTCKCLVVCVWLLSVCVCVWCLLYVSGFFQHIKVLGGSPKCFFSGGLSPNSNTKVYVNQTFFLGGGWKMFFQRKYEMTKTR